MQPAHPLLANHGTLFQRACPTSRRLLVQPEVGSVGVIIDGPVQFESGSMPAHNCVREDDNECLFPVNPEPASHDPEEFVHGSQSWARLLAFKDGELLAKGKVFEHQTAARPQPAKHGSEPEPKQVKHGNQVIADRLCRSPREVVDFTAGQDCDEAHVGCPQKD